MELGLTVGNGALNITNGGEVSCDSGSVGHIFSNQVLSNVTLEGGGSKWTIGDELTIGDLSDGSMHILNGGAVNNVDGIIGDWENVTGEVTVDGAGSIWTNSEMLYVGRSGSGILNIANGGEVQVEGQTYVAFDTGSSGSVHFNNGTLATGGLICTFEDLSGSGVINTGGLVTDTTLVFDATHGLNQTFLINGSPGQNINLDLRVDGAGAMGAGCNGIGSMRVADGMAITSTGGYIGIKSDSVGHVVVEDSGSNWSNSSHLYVGHSGSGSMDIINGGVVSNLGGYIGFQGGSSGDVTVEGENSKWTCYENLSVGYMGDGVMNIINGGVVGSRTRYIGERGNSTGHVTVDGAGSKWTGVGLYIGSNENSYGVLSITNGGYVSNTYGAIGLSSEASGMVTVDGADSEWAISQYYYIGRYGGGTVHITGGGTASTGGDAFVGRETDSTGKLIVDGNGSTWTSGGDLYVGQFGDGAVHISNGGSVINRFGYIGYESGSTGEVIVEGDGSRWSNKDLYVGYNDGCSSLYIINGGVVNNDYAYISYMSDSINEVVVEGIGSTWVNNNKLYVGRYGSGLLQITNGGLVKCFSGLYIDYDGNYDSFINMANGGMLALYGDIDDSLNQFLGQVYGYYRIRYWDDAISDWSSLIGADYGQDYTLAYHTEGDLAGYTTLTVTAVPEPFTLCLLALGSVAIFGRKRFA